MDIASRTQQTIVNATKKLEPASAQRVTDLNEKFERMVRDGFAIQDSYEISTNWLSQPVVIQYRR